jgi:hypothetical protein
MPVTLRPCDWFKAAEAAGRHGWSIADVFSWFLSSYKEGLAEWSNDDYMIEDPAESSNYDFIATNGLGSVRRVEPEAQKQEAPQPAAPLTVALVYNAIFPRYPNALLSSGEQLYLGFLNRKGDLELKGGRVIDQSELSATFAAPGILEKCTVAEALKWYAETLRLGVESTGDIGLLCNLAAAQLPAKAQRKTQPQTQP